MLLLGRNPSRWGTTARTPAGESTRTRGTGWAAAGRVPPALAWRRRACWLAGGGAADRRPGRRADGAGFDEGFSLMRPACKRRAWPGIRVSGRWGQLSAQPGRW